MNKQQLASKIWESANRMRSKIEANEYKDYILGFIFYKFLSDKEIRFLRENDFEDANIESLSEEDTENVKFIQDGIGYFIAYKDLFSTWIKSGKDFDVSNVRDALSAFSRLINNSYKKVFNKIFNTLETGLSKLGDTSGSQTKAISDLLNLIKDIPMDGKQDYDVLGFIYEYLISNFAANAGKKAGEFYTPHEVSLLMSEIVANHLQGEKEIKIYDPTSGSGSLLINIGKSVAKYISNENNIKYYAQELKENTYNLTRMNLVMRGILPDNIVTRNGDTLEADWPYFDEIDQTNTYDPLYVEAVVSNPPYSQSWDPTDKETDPRYARFGIAPKTKADYAFLLHDLFHLKPNGIMTIILPHGVLFRGGEEGAIRKNLIEQNHIDTIIGLPANIFFGTGIPTVIMVLKQNRQNTDILIIDASKGFAKVGKNNLLRACDIKKISDAVAHRADISKFSRVVSRSEIRSNEYNLNIPRYVDSSEKAESWDIYASMFGGIPMTELNELQDYWDAFPTLKTSIFTDIGAPYVALAVENVKYSIQEHEDIKKFEQKFDDAFNSFGEYLKAALIDQIETIHISKAEASFSADIFDRLKDVALINKYEAYQLLDDDWTKIAVDLEIIQTEGFAATRKVDPNFVIKKKDGKDQEIQEGWTGHVIPFSLVQATLLRVEAEEIQNKEIQLADITPQYEELIESFSEEEKESDLINDAQDAFVPKEVVRLVREINADKKKGIRFFEDSLEAKVLEIDQLMELEKQLKKEIKEQTDKLHILTKKTIENLSDAQVINLLEKKWISPLVESLYNMPRTTVNELATKLQAISEKYSVTYSQIENEIHESERILSSLIDELSGDEFDMKGLREFQSLLEGN